MIPIGETPKDIGDQAYQGEYGFGPKHREIKASHFPGRTIIAKVWFPNGPGEVRRLA